MKNIVNTNNHKQIYMQYDKNVYLKIETGFVHFCLYLMLGAYGTLGGNLPITRKTMTIKINISLMKIKVRRMTEKKKANSISQVSRQSCT